MAFSINVDMDVEAVRARMAEAGNQYAFATSKALNDLAFKVVAAQRKSMSTVFDRPRQWTLNSMEVVRGTKANPTATVRFKQGAGQYIVTQALGGQRRETGAENLLRAKFGGLAAAIPGRGARLDAYGNYLKTAEAKKASSGVLDQPAAPQPGKRKGTRRREFSVPVADEGGLKPGLYSRVGKAPAKLLMAFVQRRPTYQKLLPWFATAEATVRSEFASTFKAVLAGLTPRR